MRLYFWYKSLQMALTFFIFYIVTTGRGVFTKIPFYKGDFLLEYQGELISAEEAEKRELHYSNDVSSFLFYFQDDHKHLW